MLDNASLADGRLSSISRTLSRIIETSDSECNKTPNGDLPPKEKVSLDIIDHVARLSYKSDDDVHAEQENRTQEGDFPEGGLRAWIVVFGISCCTFVTFGFLNSWGIFQAYYQETILKEYSPSQIAWIGSLQFSLVSFPGLIVGRLYDIGYFRHIFLSASVLLVCATFLIGQCTEYWHFVLCQGIAVGIACGSLFGCCNAVIPHWFKKKRSTALGYGALGSGISGAVVPIACKNLIPLVGFPWTMRILGFIVLIMVGICNITIRTRLPPVNMKGGLFNFAVFKHAPFTIFCISSLLLVLGLYTFPTYISVSATRSGTSPELAFYFVAFSNASSLFGRWSVGILGDILGPLNVIIPYIFLAGIMTFIWPFAHSTASLVVITVIYGFSVGSYVTLSIGPIMNMGNEGDVGRRVGMFLTVLAFGVLSGPPISGAIIARAGGFEEAGIYAGSMILLGGSCMLLVRYLALQQWSGKI